MTGPAPGPMRACALCAAAYADPYADTPEAPENTATCPACRAKAAAAGAAEATGAEAKSAAATGAAVSGQPLHGVWGAPFRK